jgi:hypothetical protein
MTTTRENLVGMLTTCRNDAIDLYKTGELSDDEYRVTVTALNLAKQTLTTSREMAVTA